MAFAVVCKSCQARFLLNDDLLRRKVAGKVVTVRCRQCHATIEVDASDVDPKTLPENVRPAPPAPPPPRATTSTLKLKPAPAPPRPKSATLMGIGSPTRPAGATEMVALSAGFLNMSPAAPQVAAQGFPEPPPPPGAVEDLSSGDWEVAETPAIAKADAAPESLDDFVEELPPSLPPSDEEVPSSSGIPSLKALSHHDEPSAKPRVDDFFSNMSAAMNGGIMAGDGAPTIDVSALTAAPAEAEPAPNIDMSALDVPIDRKKTLPLFGIADDDLATPAAPPAHASRSPAAGSLSPATVDRAPRDPERPDSVRERKNVVAPATKSVPPAAPSPKRSGLAAPVLIALAAAAAFLIWRRSAHAPVDVAAQPEQPAARTEAAAPAVKAPDNQPPMPDAIASVAPAPTAADDVTFETTPTKAASPAVATPAHDKAAAAAPAASPPAEKPAAGTPEPKAEPAPIAKEEPKPAVAEPAEPAEPAGPFDRAAAAAALNASAAQASACRKDGDPSGVASVVITFAPSGRVTSANISGPPFAGTPTGGCIASALRKARVPAFDGDRVTVSKSIVIQ